MYVFHVFHIIFQTVFLRKRLTLKDKMSQGQYFFYDLDTLYIILSMSPDNLKGYKIKKFNDKD